MAILTHKKSKSANIKKDEKFPVFPQFGENHFTNGKRTRKKVNFMVCTDLLEAMKFFIPDGEKSNFVNNALEEALKDFSRKKASEMMDELREQANIKLTTAQIIKLKNYGRK